MDAMIDNLATINEKLARREKSFEEFMERKWNFETMLDNFVEEVEEQLKRQEESVNEITRQLEKMRQLTSHEVKVGDMKKGITEADEVDREPKVVVVGGFCNYPSNFVEMFCLAKRAWTPLRKMRENRSGASAVVHNNQIFVSGGFTSITHTKSIVKLSMNAVHVDQSIPWENFPAELLLMLAGHCSVVYNGQLIVIGGCDAGKHAYSDNITEISLVPPYTSRQLATIPQIRCYHGVAIFGDKILIVAGKERYESKSALSSVVTYDITKNEFQELAPLPHPMCAMATVKWDDDSVMIMGGVGSDNKPLNKVLMYNIKTQKIQMLPDMKYKRRGCVAAVVKDTVIVMGGQGEKGNHLKSVESFRFDRYSWEELPEMHEARAWATVVVC